MPIDIAMNLLRRDLNWSCESGENSDVKLFPVAEAEGYAVVLDDEVFKRRRALSVDV